MSYLLLSNQNRLHQNYFHIKGKTDWNLNEIKITQKFFNNSQEPTEATLVYPILNEAIISSLVIRTPDNLIKAEIFEKEAAKTKYTDALASGKRAYLSELSDESQDLLTFNIGNLDPNIEISIEFTLVMESIYLSETDS